MSDQGTPEWFAAWLGRPKSILFWSLALFCAGAWAACQVDLEWVPSVELPTITINAYWPGAAPRAVERYVTAPIERALTGVSGTANLQSISREGQASIRLESSAGEKLGLHLEEVSAHLAVARASLPTAS